MPINKEKSKRVVAIMPIQLAEDFGKAAKNNGFKSMSAYMVKLAHDAVQLNKAKDRA